MPVSTNDTPLRLRQPFSKRVLQRARADAISAETLPGTMPRKNKTMATKTPVKRETKAMKAAHNTMVMSVPVSELQVDDTFNIRQNYIGIPELAKSIKDNGQENPVDVVVIDGSKGKKYRLIAGFRRTRAIMEAGLPLIRVQVRELKGETEEEREFEARMLNVRENLERSELTPYEKGLICVDLENRGLKREEIAKALKSSVAGHGEGTRKGKGMFSLQYIDNLRRCIKTLHPSLLEQWKDGLMTTTRATALAYKYDESLADPYDLQLKAAEGYGGDANGAAREAPTGSSGFKRPSRKKLEAALEMLESQEEKSVLAAGAASGLRYALGLEESVWDSDGVSMLAEGAMAA